MPPIQSMEDELKNCPELRLEDVKALREWANRQPHFPNLDEVPDVYIALFLRRRYYSIEQAKKTIDNVLTFRTHTEELCHNRTTTSQKMINCFNAVYFFAMDKVDRNGNVVTFQVLRDPDPTNYDPETLFKRSLMLGDAWLLENGSANGFTYVFDQRGFSASHMLRLPMSYVKKVNYFNKECSPISVKNIYITNANASTQTFVSLLRPFMEDELFKKLKVFTADEMDQLFEYLPKECVPEDFGGEACTMDELHEKSIALIKRHEDFYEMTEHLLVDESKRPGSPINMSSVLGIQGSFKKLNVD